MDLKDKLTMAGLTVAFLSVVTKMKIFENWLDEYLKRWVAKRSAQLAPAVQRPPDDFWAKALTSGRSELETLCLYIKQEYQVDRITVMEYERVNNRLLATCIVEERTARMPSVRAAFQKAPMLPEIEAEIYRVHSLDCHCLFVPVARLVELPAMRAALVASGVSSAYYQTLPATAGHAGGLLSLSWQEERQLTPQDLAALHLSAFGLVGVLRMLWVLTPPVTPLSGP